MRAPINSAPLLHPARRDLLYKIFFYIKSATPSLFSGGPATTNQQADMLRPYPPPPDPALRLRSFIVERCVQHEDNSFTFRVKGSLEYGQ